MLFSSDVDEATRVHLNRDNRGMVRKIAPWLRCLASERLR
jgi:uncharacterized membrane protein (UPF0182 family)